MKIKKYFIGAFRIILIVFISYVGIAIWAISRNIGGGSGAILTLFILIPMYYINRFIWRFGQNSQEVSQNDS